MALRSVWFPIVMLVALAPSAVAAQARDEAAPAATQRGLADPEERPSDGLFASPGWNVELSGQFMVEAWDLNVSKESLFGGTVGLGYTFAERWQVNTELSFLRVSQDTSYDVLLPVVSGIMRGRAYEGGPVTVFLEIGPGVSYASDEVPAGGTRFNLVLQAGGGMTYRLVPRLNLVGGLRWLHVSNNSLNGRSKNPDIQALGMYLGWIVG